MTRPAGTAAQQIREATIRAQLAREFADRLEIEAEAWLAVSTKKRQAALEYRMQAHKLTVEAHALRKAAGKRVAAPGKTDREEELEL